MVAYGELVYGWIC